MRPTRHSFPKSLSQSASLVTCRLVIALIICTMVVIYPPAAVSQEAPGLSRLLQKLIRGGQPSKRDLSKQEQKRNAGRKSDRVRKPVEAAPEIPDKLENARIVLVIGDFMASGLAEGLEIAFEMSPGVRIVSAANGSSGLVRDDFYNWQEQIPVLIAEHKPSAVVIMLGANDRQQMVVGDKREPVRSTDWTKEYTTRVTTVAGAVSAANIPLVWVGMVPFKSQSASSDIIAFNDLYRSATEAVKGEFVDVWDGFVDENGGFVTRGPDINGQVARLRTGDGINVGKAGKRLLAFFAEKPLRKFLGDATASDIAVLGPENLPELTLDPISRSTSIERTKPIRLDDPDLDGGLVLLGGPTSPSLAPLTPAQLLAIEGTAAPAPDGRADNFTTDTQ